ncbi:pyruvate kinase [Streptococcus pyogenes STAB1102]|nr:pyruvate kinase [Streptococcus pyogenes STAB1102]ANC27625.1 pyruvate phosphate dikinase [Streptococcus pyogenes]EQL79903.1 PEP-utilizing TIM barrel enzyme [Streptococcus pyogenes UTSW-2]ERL07057.1 PEP-utilizing TIM barrel enzyme [Streptococcus pyogenes GA06023]ERL17903.1 PEP-utilizing TIM barrel enzyme domain protein [Streptococcus pyogenes GA41046]ESA46049.1 PEP-utilizing TIM barrel enzyme [Streptococcus pyogenes GA40468]ESA59007.1 PEP-utilizing TIM barrel enzyme [Streptococcus pyogenes G
MTGVFLIRSRSRPLIRKGLAVSLARSVKPELKLGICGEHGGDPASIDFYHSQGLTYVSCSPFRVPLTRLAAAQAAIKASGHSLTQDK